MEALGINLGYLLVQVFNFLIIFFVLRVWVYKPVVRLLEQRKERIAKSLEDARIAEEARANAEKEAEKIIAEAQSERAGIVSAATEQAEKAAGDIRQAAEEERAQILDAAREEAEQEKVRVLGDVRNQVVTLAMAAANKIISSELDQKRQQALLNEFFSGVKDGKVVVLDEQEVSGEAAEVVSALPLDDAEQQRVKEEVIAKLGGSPTVSFRVDPSILGGLIVRVGDREIDGSARSKLENLRQSLG